MTVAGRRWGGTLRVRVTAAAVLLLTVALGVSVAGLTWFLGNTITENVEDHLENQIAEVVALARSGRLPSAITPSGRESGQVQVITADGQVVARSSGVASSTRFDVLARPAPGRQVSATVDGARVDGDHGEHYRVVARATDTPTGPVVVYGASTLRGADRAVHALWSASLVGIPALVLLAALFAWKAVARALDPVETMIAEVGEIEAHALDQRLAAPAGDDEFARLAHTLNHMLDRLDVAVRLQRRFAADASHELRSPLAAARAQLEVGLAYPDRTDWQATASNVLDEVNRLERLAGELLELARVDAASREETGVAPRRETVDLGELAVREVASPEWRALPLAPVVVTGPMSPVVLADPDLVVRVIRNLLTNAARHARSKVTVEVGTDPTPGAAVGGVAWLVVANDGPAIPASQRDRIFEPFARIDGARTNRAGGAGLGLAIARRIARAHDGDLVLDREAEGAAFRFSLPLAPPP